jgi:hypothetical protein
MPSSFSPERVMTRPLGGDKLSARLRSMQREGFP